ncbi:MAG: hypothetical protein P1V18_02165 [Candidatus Gracilibacteria bacterium]|nr:hypothetical protein [Candidatus Gracilibacteria bacterium]
MNQSTDVSGAPIAKFFLSFVVILLSALIGYFLVYSWVSRGVGSFFDFSSLRGQVISNQMTNDVADQLQAQGFNVSASDVTHLDQPSSSSYRANVIDGYNPSLLEENSSSPGFYFYDDGGGAYYLELDENGQVNPDNIVPLIQE